MTTLRDIASRLDDLADHTDAHTTSHLREIAEWLRSSAPAHADGQVRPLAWIVRHKADKPTDGPGTIYLFEDDAQRHADSFMPGWARVVALGDIAAAVSAERERLASLADSRTDGWHSLTASEIRAGHVGAQRSI